MLKRVFGGFVSRYGACCEPSFCSHRVHRACLQPGDHVYVWSSFAHHHHAVYVGPDRRGGTAHDSACSPPTSTCRQCVIHVYGDNKHASEIRVDTLNDFARGRPIRRARYDAAWWHMYLKPPGTVYPFARDDGAAVVERAWHWLDADQRARATQRKQQQQQDGPGPDAGTRSTAEVEQEPAKDQSGSSCETQGSEPCPMEAAPVTVLKGSPWVYNLFRRNCETFVLYTTAPTRHVGSLQARMWRYNPIATIVIGLLIRFGGAANAARPKSFRAWARGTAAAKLLERPDVVHRRARFKDNFDRVRYRGRLLRKRATWRAAAAAREARTAATATVNEARERAAQMTSALREGHGGNPKQ